MKSEFVHHIQNVESGAVVQLDPVVVVGNNGEVIVGVPSVEAQRECARYYICW